MADATPGSAPSSNREVMIVLSYLWPLALVPLLTEQDKEVQWHAKHGLLLMVAEMFLGIVISILLGPLGFFGIYGCVTVLLMPVLFLPVAALHVVCIVKGLNGQKLIIPGFSEFADKF